MEFPILVRCYLYFESGPRSFKQAFLWMSSDWSISGGSTWHGNMLHLRYLTDRVCTASWQGQDSGNWWQPEGTREVLVDFIYRTIAICFECDFGVFPFSVHQAWILTSTTRTGRICSGTHNSKEREGIWYSCGVLLTCKPTTDTCLGGDTARHKHTAIPLDCNHCTLHLPHMLLRHLIQIYSVPDYLIQCVKRATHVHQIYYSVIFREHMMHYGKKIRCPSLNNTAHICF